jgi:hypothetical protein
MKYPAIDLSGAVVLVTGAARGIGRATAVAFAQRGARVVVGDLDGAEEAARSIPGARGVKLDVTSRASFAAFADLPRIDVLVNNAGVMPLGGFLDEPDRISHVTIDVNLWGVVHGMRAVLPKMIARGKGHIVNVASMAGKIALPGMAMYNASKFAAVGLSAAVRREYAHTGVSVSAVLPAAVKTALASGVPLGRGLPTVEPEVIADAIVKSCATRKAEIPVPGFVGVWDLIEAIAPEPVMSFGRKLLGERRALTEIDPVVRKDYEGRIAAQARDRST